MEGELLRVALGKVQREMLQHMAVLGVEGVRVIEPHVHFWGCGLAHGVIAVPDGDQGGGKRVFHRTGESIARGRLQRGAEGP